MRLYLKYQLQFFLITHHNQTGSYIILSRSHRRHSNFQMASLIYQAQAHIAQVRLVKDTHLDKVDVILPAEGLDKSRVDLKRHVVRVVDGKNTEHHPVRFPVYKQKSFN